MLLINTIPHYQRFTHIFIHRVINNCAHSRQLFDTDPDQANGLSFRIFARIKEWQYEAEHFRLKRFCHALGVVERMRARLRFKPRKTNGDNDRLERTKTIA